VLTRILKEAGKANKTVYAFFLDVRKAYDTLSGGMQCQLLERCGWKLWRVLRDLAVKSTSQVRVNEDCQEFAGGVGEDLLWLVRYLYR
jgi:hypothetical protein